MNINESIESVEIVDELMTYFRNGMTPPDACIIRAYEMGINVSYLKSFIEEVEHGGERETDQECDGDDTY